MSKILIADDKLRAELGRGLEAVNVGTIGHVNHMNLIIATAAALGSAPGLSEFIDSIPKGSTPNKYKPHQGNKEMQRRKAKS
jgi:hypothetical protein